MFLNSVFLQVSGDVEYLTTQLVGVITNSTNSNNWIQYFLTLAVIATAFITFYYNRKTHAQTEREIKIRLRPVLARLHSMGNKEPTGTMILGFDGESYRFNQEKLSIHFINNGTLPANSVSYQYYVGVLEENKLLSNKMIKENIPLPDLSAHEHYSIDIPWTQIHYGEAMKGENCYFGLEIKYSAKDSKEAYVYSFEGYLKDKYLMIEKSHITQNSSLFLSEIFTIIETIHLRRRSCITN